MRSALTTRWIVLSIITLGFSEMLSQMVLTREFLSVFYGNELVIGIVLANWLLLSGVGSYLGRKAGRIKDSSRILVYMQMAMAVLLPIQLYVIRNLYDFAFVRGELVGITQVFIVTFLVMLPTCFITGFSLPLFSEMYSEKRKAGQIGKVYALDSLSNIIGGVVFSFILVYYLNAYQIASIVFFVCLCSAAVVSYRLGHRWVSALLILLLFAGLVLSFSTNMEWYTARQQFPMQKVLVVKDSEYGKFVVTNTSGQINVYQDGMPLFSTQNEQVREEKVHYAMLQHKSPKDVLLISGGAAGTALEAMKYGAHVDYVETDPVLIAIGKVYTHNIDNANVSVYNTDPIQFVRRTQRKFDVVIVDVPDPSNAQTNRFYTQDFYLALKRILPEGGVVGVSVSSGMNYMNEETKMLDSAVYNSLKTAFRNVLVLPGERMYFVASDAKLSYSVYDNITIPTTYFRKEYLSETLDKERITSAVDALKSRDDVNTDFRPVAYYYHLLYWQMQSGTSYALLVISVLVFLAFCLWKITKHEFALFSVGFVGMAMELVLIFGFQIVYGHVYQKIGIIITSFMTGLALGAWFGNDIKFGKRTISGVCFLAGSYAALLPIIISIMSNVSNATILALISNIVFPLLTGITGLLVGFIFPIVARQNFKDVEVTSGRLYFYDYAGACIGALSVSAVLIPLLGIWGVSFAAALVVTAAGAINLFK
jgi:spermidine synthase